MTVATYPAYDGSPDASAWFYGMAPTLAGTGTGDYFLGTGAGWCYWTMPLTLNPGTYYITELGFLAGFTNAAEIGGARFAIFSDAAGTLSPLTLGDGSNYVDMTAGITLNVNGLGADVGPVAVSSVSFTLAAATTYHIAFALQRGASPVNNHPGVCLMNNGMGPQGLTVYKTADMATFPAVHAASANATGEVPRGYMKFTTAVRTLVSTSYAAAKSILAPRRTDGDFCMKLRSAVVADGQALTCVMHYDNQGDDATRATLVLDMAATNQVTFGETSNALGAGEVGDTFDLLYEQRADGKADVFYLNKTTGAGPLGAEDFATISHAVLGNSGTRGSEYTVAVPDYYKLSGTAAVAGIEVGWEPIVIFGDSQCSRNNEGSISSSYRLGTHLPTAFTHDRIYWPAFIAGSLITANNGTAHTAAYKRYKATTGGQGDLCEMTTPLFIIGGIGINDISTVVGTTEANRNKIIGLMATRIAEILDDLQDRAIPTLIIGLPPYSNADASAQEAGAVQQWNICLEGLACGVRAAYVNPWHVMCAGGTAGAEIPTMAAAYTDDEGLHYNTDGAAIVADAAARSLETAIVGGWWGNPAKRLARKRGFLMP